MGNIIPAEVIHEGSELLRRRGVIPTLSFRSLASGFIRSCYIWVDTAGWSGTKSFNVIRESVGLAAFSLLSVTTGTPDDSATGLAVAVEVGQRIDVSLVQQTNTLPITGKIYFLMLVEESE